MTGLLFGAIISNYCVALMFQFACVFMCVYCVSVSFGPTHIETCKIALFGVQFQKQAAKHMIATRVPCW